MFVKHLEVPVANSLHVINKRLPCLWFPWRRHRLQLLVKTMPRGQGNDDRLLEHNGSFLKIEELDIELELDIEIEH